MTSKGAILLTVTSKFKLAVDGSVDMPRRKWKIVMCCWCTPRWQSKHICQRAISHSQVSVVIIVVVNDSSSSSSSSHMKPRMRSDLKHVMSGAVYARIQRADRVVSSTTTRLLPADRLRYSSNIHQQFISGWLCKPSDAAVRISGQCLVFNTLHER